MSVSKPRQAVVALANYTFKVPAQMTNGLVKPSKTKGKNFEIAFAINTEEKEEKEGEKKKNIIKPQ